jgi:hypothetical protein
MQKIFLSTSLLQVLLWVLVITSTSSCIRTPRLSPEALAQGAVDPSGRRQGDWVVYHNPGDVVLGTGRFVDGAPDGPWTIYDTKGKKVGEVEYRNGCVDGNYRLWYGHKYAATFVKTYGQARNCQLDGAFERYLPDGRLLVRYKAAQGLVVSVQSGSWRDAEEQLQADKDLLAMYHSFIIGRSA